MLCNDTVHFPIVDALAAQVPVLNAPPLYMLFANMLYNPHFWDQFIDLAAQVPVELVGVAPAVEFDFTGSGA